MDEELKFFENHDKIALQFSGGKDSLATLYWLEPYWDKVDVIWGNPGNPYPEVVEFMRGIEKLVPNFIEVRGNQPAYIKSEGYPTDILPYEFMPNMGILTGKDYGKMVPFQLCCAANLWGPLLGFMRSQGYTGVIRGQKKCDAQQNYHNHSGNTIDGIEYYYPINDWTDSMVFAYLGDRTPEYYRRGLQTSLDCMNCTAWLKENKGMLKDLERNYPETAAEIKPIFLKLRERVRDYSELLENIDGP